jgi:hypothetical protein
MSTDVGVYYYHWWAFGFCYHRIVYLHSLLGPIIVIFLHGSCKVIWAIHVISPWPFQAVSLWLFTSKAWAQTRVIKVVLSVFEVAVGQTFVQIFRFSVSVIPPVVHNHLEQCFSTAGPRPGTGPSSYIKRINRAAVSHRLRTTDLEYHQALIQ